MKYFIYLGLLCSVVISISNCEKDEPAQMASPAEAQPQQYSTPYDQVPAIPDINMYEVNPRVFSTSDDLDGITARLEQLQELGVNVVWLMPIFQTGSARSVGSPYAIKDYYAIHPDYGSLEDLRELVDKAHSLDMAVILDWVANHTAWDHKWMQNPSWYEQNANGDIIHPPGTNWLDVAELNYDSHDMREAMIKAMKYWILEANVDGYRCDFAGGAPVDFWTAAIDTLRSIPERELILFAESSEKALLAADFDLLFGWAYYDQLKRVFNGNPAQQLHYMHTEEYEGLGSEQHIVRWVTNHDQHAWEATPQQVFGSQKASMAAFVIASTMGGVPLVYNGQEVAVPDQLPFFEGQEYTIDWSMNAATREAYQNLLQFRLQSEALRRGGITDYSSSAIAAFTRQTGDETVLVMVNVRDEPHSFAIPESLQGTSWQVITQNTTLTIGEQAELDAYEYRILQQR
ncbi:MAG: alpha-amylase [Bacteroidetes bacterium]|jgi:glycosidase|nr:alpha-amylase [Bacteroidota bacterium]